MCPKNGGQYKYNARYSYTNIPFIYRVSTVYQPYMYRDLQRRERVLRRFFDKLVERNIESPTRKAREIL